MHVDFPTGWDLAPYLLAGTNPVGITFRVAMWIFRAKKFAEQNDSPLEKVLRKQHDNDLAWFQSLWAGGENSPMTEERKLLGHFAKGHWWFAMPSWEADP